jgi:hypothetical protein
MLRFEGRGKLEDLGIEMNSFDQNLAKMVRVQYPEISILKRKMSLRPFSE